MTKSRLVHDIDSALDLKNYGRFDIPETEKKIIGVIKDNNSTEEIHFTNNPQNVLNVGRVSRHNIIRGPVGLNNAASKAKTEIDHFLLFITHEMLADVLHHTNKKIDSLLAKLPADFNKAVGPPMSEDKGRCHVCISNLAGVEHKLKKNQMYRVKTLCRICKKYTCEDYLISTCEICREHQKK